MSLSLPCTRNESYASSYQPKETWPFMNPIKKQEAANKPDVVAILTFRSLFN